MPQAPTRAYLSAPGREELPALTGLRIVAAVAVIGWHCTHLMPFVLPPFNHGYLGVDLFFMLSGFIIAHVYWQDFLLPSRPLYLRFVALRVARLWPAHIAALLLVIAAALASSRIGQAPFPAGEFLLHLVLAHNWGLLPETTLNYPSWSISAEFLAYLLFPLQVALFRRVRSLWLLLLSVPLALALCGLVLTVWFELSLVYSGPLANVRAISEFAIGVALHRLWRDGRLARLPWTAIVLGCVVAMIAIAAATPPRHAMDYAIVLLMAPLLLGLAHGAGAAARLLSWRPLVYLGEISYSIYLMHALAIFVASALFVRLPSIFGGRETGWDMVAVAVALAFLGGVMLFHLVEKPARHWLRARIDRHLPAPPAARTPTAAS